MGNSLTQPEVIEGLWSVTAGEIVFQILRYVYLTLLIVQFILAMGNRPQGYLFISNTYYYLIIVSIYTYNH